MAARNLEQKIQEIGSPVEMMRTSPVGAYVYPVPAEFSNWRDEQKAWRETAVLFDQSAHMTDIYFEGPDVIRLLSETGVNSFESFTPGKAKQFVPCNDDGYVIGDAILFHLAQNRVNVVGRPPVANWLEFRARTGGYDVRVERDERTVANRGARKTYRYQLQGPNAWKILEKVNGGPLPEIKFFNMGEITIAGRKVRALRHGMAGEPGLEFWGPSEEGSEIRAAVLEAGREFGLLPSGFRAYATSALEAGWIPSPMPAIYSGGKMRPYREWLPADGFEAMSSLGGSFYSDDVEDYYLTPWDLGYGHVVKFDHDFIGREALEQKAHEPHRKKVTLVWNSKDVVRIFASLFGEGEPAKYLELPAAHYATLPYDKVSVGNEMAGISTYSGYNANERAWLSLAMIDERWSKPGTEVTLTWGEEDGGTPRPVVERHAQTKVRATVAPCPYSTVAREAYRV
ncbi:vanillate/3-O-methylgallate O-demethylase [Chelativorans salis]|uniref:Aminomethyltransferase family protein n=1 Tax=Chelativorans salis TaxID=2978478 RepID=A0ABT2LV22_9HYPH|nr:aminomethyltransferase family protein [Chelativorans sp. EGI FJ00035]MCT7378386.1 aminomethyltransferase family protein [Chelativorans sp. EGI FJ00035]